MEFVLILAFITSNTPTLDYSCLEIIPILFQQECDRNGLSTKEIFADVERDILVQRTLKGRLRQGVTTLGGILWS
jgi:hypothetical protein